MPSTKDSYGEDVSLLYPDNQNDKLNRFSETHCETPIIKGVVNQLRKWPTDLFFAFLAACLILGSLVFLIFVTVAVSLPTVVCCREEEMAMLEMGPSPSVYFLKLGNQNWSTMDLCYIETAAYRHPDLNIYLIKLTREEPFGASFNESIVNKTNSESRQYDSSLLTMEDKLRERLARANSNIKNINVSIDRFFKGSKLSKIVRELNDETLEIAAKSQLLWSVPGIAIQPNMFCNLDSLKEFLCNRKKENQEECLPDKLATIEPDNDIQITGVPCQAFMGFLLQEISKKYQNGKFTLREALKKYCPRSHYCPEIRILDTKTKCPTDALNCPLIYSSILMHDYLNLENLIT